MFNYPNRLVCSALEEMRKQVKNINIFTYHRNKAMLNSLIEEVQTYVNRMESALEYKSDIEELHKKRKKLRDEVKKLKEQLPEDE